MCPKYRCRMYLHCIHMVQKVVFTCIDVYYEGMTQNVVGMNYRVYVHGNLRYPRPKATPPKK